MSKQTMFYMKKCAPIFSMLQDERRQEITQLLFENRELSVTALTEKLSLSRPAVSHHLKQLKMTGLIISRRDGKEVYYKAADTVQAQVIHHMIEQAIEISCPYSIDDRQKEDA